MGDVDFGVSVVIPAFDEEHRLPRTVNRLLEVLPHVCPAGWEIIVSDDGSQDRTVPVVRELASPPVLRVLTSERNVGKGAALLAGVRAAIYPVVLLLDADLPVPISDIREMIRLAEDNALVLGSRRMEGATVDPPQPLVRRIGGRLLLVAISGLGFRIPSDPQCGVKVVRSDLIGPALDGIRSSRFAFDVELIERCRRIGARIVEVPVHWRHVEGSSLRPCRDAITTMAELRRVRAELSARVTGEPALP